MIKNMKSALTAMTGVKAIVAWGLVSGKGGDMKWRNIGAVLGTLGNVVLAAFVFALPARAQQETESCGEACDSGGSVSCTCSGEYCGCEADSSWGCSAWCATGCASGADCGS